MAEPDSIKLLFSENIGIIIQSKDDSIEQVFNTNNIDAIKIGVVTDGDTLNIRNNDTNYALSVSELRDTWYKTSFLLDQKQTANGLANDRFENYKLQPLQYTFPSHFTGKLQDVVGSIKSVRPKAAILREKGSNSEREMANAMYLAGFDVKDVHMTDLISGRETLEDIQLSLIHI